MYILPTAGSVWFSKNLEHEKPQCVTGAFKLIGSKQTPKDICKDRIIGTWKGIRSLRR
jgi:hypothetical protein